MSAIDPAIVFPAAAEPVAVEVSSSKLARFEGWLERTGEHLNPILVKECRQALKSRQFVITFGMVLICGWGWSVLGVAMEGPEIFYKFSGPDMFFGYYVILAFPLFVIVPYGAFRSLAAEREDRTYELLSITTLRPRQIVGGKLGSAVVQMVVYFSAISPCIVFTYMLRGIDMLTIVLILAYAFLASLGLSLISLLIATMSRQKHWQIVLSVALILGLAYLTIMLCAATYGILQMGNSGYAEPWFWIGNLAGLSGYASYFLLFYLTAAAQLTFSSDNRSTPLRWVMLLQHLMFTGWMVWGGWKAMTENAGGEAIGALLVMYLVFVGLHWWIMGLFLTGEWPELSPRVKRRLPQSFFGRAFLTWFNPGPGTGYMFAMGNLLTAVLLVLGTCWGWYIIDPTGAAAVRFGPDLDEVALFAVLGYAYVAGYLGLSTLGITVLRRFTPVGMPFSLLFQALLLMLGCGVPLLIYAMTDLRGGSWTPLHITNPVWTLIEAVDGSSVNFPVALVLIPIAGFIFLLNVPQVAYEVSQLRIAKPMRVAEEDAQIEALTTPVVVVRTSPWDDEEERGQDSGFRIQEDRS